jgi:hypothetical protein
VVIPARWPSRSIGLGLSSTECLGVAGFMERVPQTD